ncbi:hypothetical protein [Azospirillum argentinense]|nr:hypothetical protein [Azospirillum argentinense]
MALTEAFSLIASYAFIDAEITKDNPAVGSSTSSVGLRPKGFRATWPRPGRLHLQGGTAGRARPRAGVRYVGSSKNIANTASIPEHALIDAAIRYDLGALRPELAGPAPRSTSAT